MIINTIKLKDFGVFKGEHKLELAPAHSKGRKRPIILFGGNNGAGKTTLLKAILLALYGNYVDGAYLSRNKYNEYLRGWIHIGRSSSSDNLEGRSASVEIEFRYSRIDGADIYRVIRSWAVRNDVVTEDLTIFKNGEPLREIESDQWQNFLKGLIPPGMTQLFFFDGEKVRNLADDTTSHDEINDAIDKVLGLEIVERLLIDLDVYKSKKILNRSDKEVRRELVRLKKEERALLNKGQDISNKIGSLNSKKDHFVSEITRLEEQLGVDGGNYSNKREGWKLQEVKLDAKIRTIEEQMREMVSDLLPFSLCPDLCTKLIARLGAEEVLKKQRYFNGMLKERFIDIQREMEMNFSELSLSQCKKKAVLKMIKNRLFQSSEEESAIGLIQDISTNELHHIQAGIEQSHSIVPKKFTSLNKKLLALQKRRDKTKRVLKMIPSDDLIAPIVTQLTDKNKRLGKIEQQIRDLEQQLNSVRFQREEATRKHLKLEGEIEDLKKKERVLTLLQRSKAALEEYRSILKREKIHELENEFVSCFNKLLRKPGFIQRINIDEEKYSVTMQLSGGRYLPKDKLSEGEKQIYAIAMLQAITNISKRELPFIIDTPLGRLDSEHRGAMVDRFFPIAGQQVIILSTDTEVDKDHYRRLKPHIQQAFKLEFDKKKHFTTVQPEYFWEGGELE